MDIRRIRGFLMLSLVTAFVVTGAGCSKHVSRDGPYAEAKQNWDSPRSTELENSMRNRLATTQQDH